MVLLIVYGSLYPWDFTWRHVPGGPIWYLLHRWDSWRNRYLIRDIFTNVVLYIPLGLTGYFSFRKPLRLYLPVLAGFTLSVVVELAQIYVPDRGASMPDLFSNTGGAALGVVAGLAIRGLQLTAPQWRVEAWKTWAFLALAAAGGLWPFHFTSHPQRFGLVPFGNLIHSDGPAGLKIVFIQLVACTVAIWLFRASGKRLWHATAIVGTVALALQAAWMFIPGARPGTAGPLLAVIAGYVLDALNEPETEG